MPTLNWIGKEAVVNHDKEVPFRLLKKIKSSSVGENSQNLIIHGDNLEALKALMPYYAGKVKCIYIDPPYNTGNERWVYNDRVNSPKIKKWLGKTVGADSEDLCRHDKWLCMMYPRLKLLRDLLSDDGVIFVSIDDSEHCNLKQLFDEVFGVENFICTFVWNKKNVVQNDAKFVSNNHEYVICFTKDIENVTFNLLPRTDELNERYQNPDNDPRGVWTSVALQAKSGSETNKYEMNFPNGVMWKPVPGTYPRLNKESLMKAYNEGRLWFGKTGKNVPRLKKYLSEVKQGVVSNSLLMSEEVGSTQMAKETIKRLLEKNIFETPKPVNLIKKFIILSSNKDSIILDSFAGSGTTAHAVMDLNKEDGGNRKFILVEMEDGVVKEITTERVKRAIKKEDYKDGFEYCELDKPLFNEDGHIEEECTFEQLATYIYFTETQTNIDKKKIDKNYIGEKEETEYYLLFKEKGKNILDKEFLKKLSKDKNKKIVYADKCLISEDLLNKHNIQFKQIPYEVRVY